MFGNSRNSVRRAVWRLIACTVLSFGSVGTIFSAQERRISQRDRALNWQSTARLHHGLRSSLGTLIFGAEGIEFRSARVPSLSWLYVEIKTFDLLDAHRIVLIGYENRTWHCPGQKRFRFDLTMPVPPAVAFELSRRVDKPVRNGDPDPHATAFASIPAHHDARVGASNGFLRFREAGIDYVTRTSRDGRSWRWSDLQTLSNPDPFHFRLSGYREIFDFDLKQPMPRELFERLWDHVYARDLNLSPKTGGMQ